MALKKDEEKQVFPCFLFVLRSFSHICFLLLGASEAVALVFFHEDLLRSNGLDEASLAALQGAEPSVWRWVTRRPVRGWPGGLGRDLAWMF